MGFRGQRSSGRQTGGGYGIVMLSFGVQVCGWVLEFLGFGRDCGSSGVRCVGLLLIDLLSLGYGPMVVASPCLAPRLGTSWRPGTRLSRASAPLSGVEDVAPPM